MRLTDTGRRMDGNVEGAERVRRFNRFWSREVGLLREGLLETRHSLTEARVLYELGRESATTASELAQVLDMDEGHLSRVVTSLATATLVGRKRSPDDGRRRLLSLTRTGKAAFAELDRR